MKPFTLGAIVFVIGVAVGAMSMRQIAAVQDVIQRSQDAELVSDVAAGAGQGPGAEADDLATVLTVQHGDEFEVLWRPPIPVRFSVRLNRVDTPYSDQPGGREATEALADLVYGKKVRIEFEDPSEPTQDRSNRLIAYVWSDGEMVNTEMVRLGEGEFFTRFGEGKYAGRFRAAEAEARQANRGRWAEDASGPRP